VVLTAKFELLSGPDLWQYALLLPLACNTILVLGLPWCPDSPPFLLKTEGEASARKALRWFRGSEAEIMIESELAEMLEEAQMSNVARASVVDIFRDPSLWKPVLVGTVVNISMQLSGIDGVLYYSTRTFEAAGITVEWSQLATTFVGVVNVFATIPAMLFMDRAGRKVIQCIGLGGMAASYALITFALVAGWHSLAVFSMVSIIVFFAFGPGCVGWFIVAELTPIHARAFGTSLGLGANFFANWMIGFIFPFIHQALGSWCYMVFFATTLTLTFVTFLCVPETKGKSIAEVSKFFAPKAKLQEPLLASDSRSSQCASQCCHAGVFHTVLT